MGDDGETSSSEASSEASEDEGGDDTLRHNLGDMLGQTLGCGLSPARKRLRFRCKKSVGEVVADGYASC